MCQAAGIKSCPEAMQPEQLESMVIASPSLEVLSEIVGVDRANLCHPGTTVGDSLVEVVKNDLSSCPTLSPALK